MRLRFGFGIATVVAFLVALGAVAALAAGTFTDDDGNTHEGNIEAIAAEGITKGCNPPMNDLYCPEDPVTRGQMAAFIRRALEDRLSPTNPVEFDDIDGSVFEADIEYLGATGVTRGCNPPANNLYCPDDFVTRGQMAAFLVRALEYADDGGGDLFVDDDGSTFEDDIDKLATAGVTKGCNPPANDEYCPDDLVLRDQMASFLARALNLDPITPTGRAFAVAYTDVDVNDGGYNPDVDRLIAKFVDGNDDAVPNAGDLVITGEYPTDVEATTFEQFGVQQHTVTGVGERSAEHCWVGSESGPFRWNHENLFAEGYVEATPQGDAISVITDGFETAADDHIKMDARSPSKPAHTFSVDGFVSVDQPFIDIELNCQ